MNPHFTSNAAMAWHGPKLSPRQNSAFVQLRETGSGFGSNDAGELSKDFRFQAFGVELSAKVVFET